MKETRIGDITIDAVIEREGPWRRPPRVSVHRRYGEGSGALRRTPHSQQDAFSSKTLSLEASAGL
jgi:hypothetical protein